MVHFNSWEGTYEIFMKVVLFDRMQFLGNKYFGSVRPCNTCEKPYIPKNTLEENLYQVNIP